jgi:hypothetical protein
VENLLLEPKWHLATSVEKEKKYSQSYACNVVQR